MSRTIIAIMVSVAALMTTSAQAQPGWLQFQSANKVGVRQASVSFADLDLNREPGRKMLRQRVSYALKMVCSAEGGTRTLTDLEGQCRRANGAKVEQDVAQLIQTRSTGRQIAQNDVNIGR